MPLFIAVRALSFAGLYALARLVPWSFAFPFFIATLWAHYSVQIVYSPRQISYLTDRKFHFWRLGLVLAGCAILMKTWPVSLPLLFGLHFVLTEVYTGTLRIEDFAITLARLVANSAIYAVCMPTTPLFNDLSRPWLFAVAVGACAVTFALAWRAKESQRVRALAVYDLVGLVCAAALPTKDRAELMNINFYHIVWWTLVPFAQLNGGRAKSIFIGYQVAFSTLFFVGVSFIAAALANADALIALSSSLGYAHIALSFVLSSSNPRWINAIFQPRKTSASVSTPTAGVLQKAG